MSQFRFISINEPVTSINHRLLAQITGNDTILPRINVEKKSENANLKYLYRLIELVDDSSQEMQEQEYIELMNYLKSLYE